MKKALLSFSAVLLLVVALSSCATNRDCHGVKHTTLANGVRI